MRKNAVFVFVLLFFCLTLPYHRAEAGDEPVNISGSTIWGDTDKKITYIEGNVRISQGKTKLTTKKAEINLDQKTAILNQGVQLTNPDVIIKAESLEYNFKKKTGIFKNKVTLQQVEAKSSAGEPKKNDPFKLTAGEVYFESENKSFTAKDNAVVDSKDFSGSADVIEYHDKEQQLLFNGKASFNRNTAKSTQNNNGQDPFTLTADRIEFKTDIKNFTAKDNAAIKNKDFAGTADTIDYNDKEQQLMFTGNVRIVQGTTVITTEEAVINLDKKLLLFEKHVKSSSDDVSIEAGGLEYDYNKKTGTFRKNVVLNRNGVKADQKKTAQDPFKLTADELYFETDTRNFTAKHNGILEHKDFNGGGDVIEYNDKLQQLTFEDNAYLNRPQGEEIKGSLISIDLRDKNLKIHNNGAVNIQINDDSEN